MPPTSVSRRLLTIIGIISVVLWLLVCHAALADIVFMDDGFVLRGKIQREGDFWVQSGDVWIPRAGGFYMVDDQVRRVVFNQRFVSEAMPDPDGKEPGERIDFRRALGWTAQTPLAHALSIDDLGKWKPTGERRVKISMGALGTSLDQLITGATPYGVQMATRNYRWKSSYFTQEFEPTELFTILRTQLEKKGAAEPPLATRLRLFRFCVQAGWFDLATTELNSLLADFPDQKEDLTKAQAEMKRMMAAKGLEEIQQAERAGQWLRLRQLLADFQDEGADDQTLTKVHIIRSRLQEQTADLEALRKYLNELRRQTSDINFQKITQSMLQEIDQGLNLDTAPRLAAMLTLSRQEETRRSRGLKAELTPEQLLALGLSGWILGAPGAESRTDIALELCRGREFLKAYLQTDGIAQREVLREDYLRQSPASVDVILQVLRLLPPQNPGLQPPDGVFDARTPPSEHWKQGVPYRVQLPPEYHPHRMYPLLVVLPNLGETAKETMPLWSGLASKFGFILISIDWVNGATERYQGSIPEQAMVIEALKDMRRKYCVDSDRVFLAGQGVAGTMTYDIALTYPDQFAAAVVLCGNIPVTANTLFANAQNLPFYVVDGEKTYNRPKDTRGLFEKWIGMGFPCMYVEYQGRGHEFYKAELPIIMDWLSRRKRGRSLPELGKPEIPTRPGQELRTYRDSARHFYWLSTEGVIPRSHGVRLAGHVGQGNSLVVYSTNASQLSVWLNSGMVDFDQPIEITVNPRSGSGRRFHERVPPNIRILLEDFHARQDRSLLFIGRVDFNLK